MTVVKQTRHLFDTCDILQLRLVCGLRDKKTDQPCDGEVLYQFGVHMLPLNWRCPKCGESWQQQFPSTQEAASRKLLEVLEILTEKDSSPFKIRFEVDGDSEETSKPL